jgi:hypothetical protein
VCKTLKAVVGTQQENRSCGLGESFMQQLRAIRINLAPGRRGEWFSHSLDPDRTWRIRCGISKEEAEARIGRLRQFAVERHCVVERYLYGVRPGNGDQAIGLARNS